MDLLKKNYYSRKEAEEQAAVARERSGDDIVAYYCGNHGSWHIGHHPYKKKKKRKR